jgi:hypothetical protein
MKGLLRPAPIKSVDRAALGIIVSLLCMYCPPELVLLKES